MTDLLTLAARAHDDTTGDNPGERVTAEQLARMRSALLALADEFEKEAVELLDAFADDLSPNREQTRLMATAAKLREVAGRG